MMVSMEKNSITERLDALEEAIVGMPRTERLRKAKTLRAAAKAFPSEAANRLLAICRAMEAL
jgi:CMP-N-acetylneuraminic acid synthetase